MRILITGVTGQVGAALLARLPSLGTIVPADRTTLDLAKLDAITDTLDRLAPDLIINPAGYTAVDKAEDETELAARVNSNAPGIVASWAATHAVPFIHFSTDYVYDGHGERAWREDDQVCPLSNYGNSKLAGENAIRASGGACLIVRTSWVYAAQGKNFLSTVVRLARERKELRIVADQIGAPTSAALIADAIFGMVAEGRDCLRDRCVQANGLVHLAAKGETSWHGFACAIVAGLKHRGMRFAVRDIVPIGTDEYPTRAKRPRNSRLEMTRLKTVFGIDPPHWQTALEPELDRLTQTQNGDGDAISGGLITHLEAEKES
jgi:dTDP-4-dehydrorhamnose reductase